MPETTPARVRYTLVVPEETQRAALRVPARRGSTCLTSTTELAPAAGTQASVAPAKFASSDRNNEKGCYAFETVISTASRRAPS